MFNKGQLEGILLSLAKPEIHVSRSKNASIGYRVRIRINFRGSEDFLKGLQRSLLQHGVDSKYKDEEHKSRPRPILSVSSLVPIWKVCQLVPDLPDAKNVWKTFESVVEIIDKGGQHTLNGLDEILKLKGEV